MTRSPSAGAAACTFASPCFERRGMDLSYAKIRAVVQERTTLDAAALAMMLGLTALWGFQQVTIKWIAPEVSFVMQAGIRSIVATALLVAWARLRGIALFSRDGTLLAGLAAGVLFGLEF